MTPETPAALPPDIVEMVDMEARLRTDESGAYRTQLSQLLEQHLTDLKRRLDAGLAPEDFSAVSAVRTAIEAAIKVVKK